MLSALVVLVFGSSAHGPAATTPTTAAQEESTVVEHPYTNRLAKETSPYLLQHAHNPVDWYPWGKEAFAAAKAQNKPVFLSIGYSACHWCHVMEHESFEDEHIAELMNELFINIKVDREERPDIDEIYMKAVQALTRSGGWPLSAWLTPDGEPFYGGTYFPPEDRFGRPGFAKICKELARVYTEDHSRVVADAGRLAEHIRQALQPPPPADGLALDRELLDNAALQICRNFDSQHGGFGGAPKFPHPMDLNFLLQLHARTGDPKLLYVTQFTLDKMISGGMYDQLGGGFHRYSVDERWMIPHFEKMLYDNGLLARCYLDAYLVTAKAEYARVVREILDYVLGEMTAPEGGFYSSQDADSEGEEGKFFVWDPADLKAVLGEKLGSLAGEFFDVTDAGNFEHGKSVLSRPQTEEEFSEAQGISLPALERDLAEARQRLLAERLTRIAPGTDHKVLADWNGLMIAAFARAGFHLNEPRYVDAARRAADFCWENLWQEGRLHRSFKDGRARFQANLGDYAFLMSGMMEVYQACFDPLYLGRAKELADNTLEHFWDDGAGGFFFVADDHEKLLARSKEAYDGAIPAAASVHSGNLARLSEFLGEPSWRERANQTLQLYSRALEQMPQALAEMLNSLDFVLSEPREIVLAGSSIEQLEPMLEQLRGSLMPRRVVLVKTPQTAAALEAVTPLVQGKDAIDGRPTAYVCQDFRCLAPVHSAEDLASALQ
jgi:hypothetical protein